MCNVSAYKDHRNHIRHLSTGGNERAIDKRKMERADLTEYICFKTCASCKGTQTAARNHNSTVVWLKKGIDSPYISVSVAHEAQ